jgi:hypothetical protein
MERSVVLDKSFLQSATKARVHELASSRRLLMSEALLYELLSKPADYRACFSKFPDIENPVDVVLHVGGFLKKEIDGRRPAPRPSDRRRRVRFKFNARLLEPDYRLPDEAAAEIARQHLEVLADTESLKSRALGALDHFPELLAGNDAARAAARVAAEELVAQPTALLDFYGQLRAPKGMKRLPPRRLINERWALYRWLQVQFLFAIDLYLRYGDSLAHPLSARVEERIEHDTLDAQYLLIGVLEGGFATEEKKLKRWYKLLVPEGLLLTRDA